MLKYSWDFNRDEELWCNATHDTIEGCIEDAISTARAYSKPCPEIVYIGENVGFTPSVDAETILDVLQDQAYDFCGEAADGWEPYDPAKQSETAELSEALTEVVADWLKKYNREPSFYAVENIKPYSLPLGGGDTVEAH